MDKETFYNIKDKKSEDIISDEGKELEDEEVTCEDAGEDDGVKHEEEGREIFHEYESVGAGSIAIIAFVLLGIIAIGITLFVYGNDKQDKKNNKTNVVEEKEKKSKYIAKKEIKKDVELNLKSFTSEKVDEIGLLVKGDLEAKLSGITITKYGDSAKREVGEVKAYNAGMVIAKNARVICSNLKIRTEGNASSGIYVEEVLEKQSIVNGNIETEGEQSPAIYTKGKLFVESTSVLSKCAEGIILEGMADVNMSISEVENKVAIYSSKKNKGTTIYMLGKGDKKNSTTTFYAKTSTINSYGGNIFDVENTKAIINLEDCKFDSDKNSIFLEAQRNASVLLTAANQKIHGNIKSDGASKLDIRLTKGSILKGAINMDDSECKAKLSLDNTSKLVLTADCYLTSFYNQLENNVNIETNGFKIYVNRKEIK